MSILQVENISHVFGGRRILENVTFRLLQGEHVGLVGANGEGKSTFLDIITGNLVPDEGKVEWCKRFTTGVLDQHVRLDNKKTIRDILRGAFSHMFELEEEMLALYERMADLSIEENGEIMEDVGEIQHMLEHNGFYTIDARIEEVAYGLGLREIGLDRLVGELSGGQRSKVLLTKLLLENPMILILDEPTNFLDPDHIRWLRQFLQEYEHSFILVSHDTGFLDEVVNVVYHVENATITRYTGNYHQFQQMHQLKKQQHLQAYEKQQKEIDRLEDFIARNKARAATATLARSRQKKLDKMDKVEKTRDKTKPVFRFTEARTPGKIIFQAKHLVIGYGEPLTRPLDILLERGQKVAIKGVNGLGKSTLLKTILGIQQPVSGMVELDPFLHPGYFEQEAGRYNTNTAMEEVWSEFPGLTNGEVRSALARCGLDYENITNQMMVLSGGENAKVRLCKLMLKPVNWLVLDEPTNHLDADAKEELKRALKDFKGTIILVSHDPAFYEGWITDLWNVEDWTTKVV
ncbi:MAG: ABC-F family ATP-binding cassette domain-containing protein [Clostridia bacterium]